MKKLLLLYLLFAVSLLGLKAQAQMFQQMLKPGDAVITCSGLHRTAGGTNPDNIVLRIINTSNTSNGKLNTTWWNSTPANCAVTSTTPPHPVSLLGNTYTSDQLGKVFGITIDNDGNIYTSRCSFYGVGEDFGNNRIGYTQIMKIDKYGAVSSFYRIPITSVTNEYSLGNLKFTEINGKKILFVSSFKDGLIYKLDFTSGTVLLSSFNPTFNDVTGSSNYNGNTTPPLGQIPFGVAVRKQGNDIKLYYSRYSKDNASPSSGFNNEIWSVNLDPTTGNFAGTETKEIDALILLCDYPVSDIAFSSDGNTMILCEMGLDNPTSANSLIDNANNAWYVPAHRAKVLKFTFNNSSSTNQWVNREKVPLGTYSNHENSAGGISFSNIVLKSNKTPKCDTTIWMTGNALFTSYSQPDANCGGQTNTFGIQGSSMNTFSDLTKSLYIDYDNDVTNGDKKQLGDVEIYNPPANCSSCQCKLWPSEAFEISLHDGDIFNTFPCGQQLSFNCNNVEGMLNELYNCDGNCTDSTVAQVYQNGQLVTTNSIRFPFDLSYFNRYKSGSFEIRVTPWCGTPGQRSSCSTCSIFINITCTPPECCSDETLVVTKKRGGALLQISTTGYSTLSQSFTVTGSKPVSELRVMIEDFKLSASNAACLKCQNPPATWGSILNAALNGNSLRLDLPGNTSSSTGPQTVTDYREMIYKPGALFNIQNSTLNLNLALPTASELDCCTINARLWVKFSFKDADCRECIQYLPLNITIIQGKIQTQPANDNPVLDRKGKPTIIKSNI